MSRAKQSIFYPIGNLLLRYLGKTGITILLTIFIAGCFGSSRSEKEPKELPPLQSSSNIDLSTLWTKFIGPSPDVFLQPLILDKDVIAAGLDGNITRFSAGKQVWRISSGHKLSSGVGWGVISGSSQQTTKDVILLGSEKGKVLAYDANTSKELWTAQISSEILTPPVVSDGVVSVRSADDRVYGFDLINGKSLWIHEHDAPSLSLRGAAGLVAQPGLFLTGMPGGKLLAISASRGTTVWQAEVAKSTGSNEVERLVDVVSTPVIEGRLGCAVAFQGEISCFDLQKGERLWKKIMSSSAGLDIADGVVVVSDEVGAVQAYNAVDGKSLWRNNKLLNRVLSRPCWWQGNVVVGDNLGMLHVLSGKDGSFIGRIALDGVISSPPQIMENQIVVQTNLGQLVAITTASPDIK